MNPSLDAVVIFHDEWDDTERLRNEFLTYHPSRNFYYAIDGNDYPPSLMGRRGVSIDRIDAMQLIYDQAAAHSPSSQKSAAALEKENLEILRLQIQRLASIADKVDSEFILFLEPDSKIRGHVSTCDPFDMTTVMPNLYEESFRSRLQLLSSSNVPAPKGWGFVTDVLRTSALSKSVNWARGKGASVLEDLVIQDSRMRVLDFLAPVIFYLSGNSVGQSTQTLECNRNRLWMFRRSPLLHQFRGNHKRFTSISKLMERSRR